MTTRCRRQILLSLSGGVLRGTWALLVGVFLVTIPGALVGGVPVPDQEYLCVVQAQTLAGTSPASNEAAFRFPGVPTAPTNLRVIP